MSSAETLSQHAGLPVLWLVGAPLPWLPGRHSRPSFLTTGTWGGGQQGLDAEKRGGRRSQSLAAGKAGERPQGFKCQPRGRPPRGHRMSSLGSLPPARASSEQNMWSLPADSSLHTHLEGHRLQVLAPRREEWRPQGPGTVELGGALAAAPMSPARP